MTAPGWTRAVRRAATTTVLAGAVALVGCSSDPERPESPVDDTSATSSSDEVSETADDADQVGSPDADAVDLATVVFDGTPLVVAAVTCEHGPEFTAQLEEGGDLRVATEDDGTNTVQIVVPRDGASEAWATDEDVELQFLLDRVEGEATLTPVDRDGGTDATREDAEIRFDLACEA